MNWQEKNEKIDAVLPKIDGALADMMPNSATKVLIKPLFCYVAGKPTCDWDEMTVQYGNQLATCTSSLCDHN